VSNHQIETKDHILTKRREHAIGIRCVLKDKHIISTEELYKEVKVCKDATRIKMAFAGRKSVKNISVEQMEVMEIIEKALESGEYMIGDSE